MSEQELLTLAAKAAGVELHGEFCGALGFPARQEQRGWWYPLTDDGDAMRLAVKLKISLHYMNGRVIAHKGGIECIESSREDCDANTRRAIVCVAACFGRAMP